MATQTQDIGVEEITPTDVGLLGASTKEATDSLTPTDGGLLGNAESQNSDNLTPNDSRFLGNSTEEEENLIGVDDFLFDGREPVRGYDEITLQEWVNIATQAIRFIWIEFDISPGETSQYYLEVE